MKWVQERRGEEDQPHHYPLFLLPNLNFSPHLSFSLSSLYSPYVGKWLTSHIGLWTVFSNKLTSLDLIKSKWKAELDRKILQMSQKSNGNNSLLIITSYLQYTMPSLED